MCGLWHFLFFTASAASAADAATVAAAATVTAATVTAAAAAAVAILLLIRCIPFSRDRLSFYIQNIFRTVYLYGRKYCF